MLFDLLEGWVENVLLLDGSGEGGLGSGLYIGGVDVGLDDVLHGVEVHLLLGHDVLLLEGGHVLLLQLHVDVLVVLILLAVDLLLVLGLGSPVQLLALVCYGLDEFVLLVDDLLPLG